MVDLAKDVANHEIKRDECGFYVVLSPREGQEFSQPTRLEIILKSNRHFFTKTVLLLMFCAVTRARTTSETYTGLPTLTRSSKGKFTGYYTTSNGHLILAERVTTVC